MQPTHLGHMWGCGMCSRAWPAASCPSDMRGGLQGAHSGRQGSQQVWLAAKPLLRWATVTTAEVGLQPKGWLCRSDGLVGGQQMLENDLLSI